MSEKWTFGEEALAQTQTLADLIRQVTGLALALESDQVAVDRLIAELRAAVQTLAPVVPADLAPRLGSGWRPEQRVYLDHSRDIGSFNPVFPEYTIDVDGAHAHGEVAFPLVYEGPPGVVHGGVLGTFFDCAVQHHNCEVGVAGKTTSLLVEYRRPTPLAKTLRFEIDRTVEDHRIVSEARLLDADDLLCAAAVKAVEGDHAKLPIVSPRRAVS